MSADTLEDDVKRILLDVLDEIGEEDIVPGAAFMTDLGANSVDFLDLVIAFENEFDIAIPDEDSKSIQTVGAAIEYIRKHQSQS